MSGPDGLVPSVSTVAKPIYWMAGSVGPLVCLDRFGQSPEKTAAPATRTVPGATKEAAAAPILAATDKIEPPSNGRDD